MAVGVGAGVGALIQTMTVIHNNMYYIWGLTMRPIKSDYMHLKMAGAECTVKF